MFSLHSQGGSPEAVSCALYSLVDGVESYDQLVSVDDRLH